jgi:hypothetical protein
VFGQPSRETILDSVHMRPPLDSNMPWMKRLTTLHSQLLDTNGRATTTTMHSHVRRNAYVYTTADLAMTVLDCDETTFPKVPLAPDNHSGSGTAADCIKETSPIPIQAALNKLGLHDSPQRGVVSAQYVKRF